MAEQEEKPIRVVDRRMFTPEGELRADFQPEDAAETAPPAPPSEPAGERPGGVPGGGRTAPGAATRPEEPPEAREPRTAFASLVSWIATNAYAALGLLSDAAGRSHRDITAARQMIDWLATLEQKTRGNLSFEESDFLSRALYELRLAFVEISRRPAQ
jgi:hypothetical protein